MEVVLAGSFAFRLIDAFFHGGPICGTADPPDWVVNEVSDFLESYPMVWFILNLAFMALFCRGLVHLRDRLEASATGAVVIHKSLALPFDVKRFRWVRQLVCAAPPDASRSQVMRRKIIVSAERIRAGGREVEILEYKEPSLSKLGRAGVFVDLVRDAASAPP